MLSQFSGSLDNAHDVFHFFCDGLIQQLDINISNKDMMDWFLVKFTVFIDNLSHVLEHSLSEERDNGTH